MYTIPPIFYHLSEEIYNATSPLHETGILAFPDSHFPSSQNADIELHNHLSDRTNSPLSFHFNGSCWFYCRFVGFFSLCWALDRKENAFFDLSDLGYFYHLSILLYLICCTRNLHLFDSFLRSNCLVRHLCDSHLCWFLCLDVEDYRRGLFS